RAAGTEGADGAHGARHRRGIVREQRILRDAAAPPGRRRPRCGDDRVVIEERHQQAIRTGRGDRRRRKGVAAYDGTRGRVDRADPDVGTIAAPAGAIVGGNPFTTPPITTTGPNRLLV